MNEDASDLIGSKPAQPMVAAIPIPQSRTRDDYFHQRTAETEKTVKMYAQVGCPFDKIARRLDISVETLNKHYAEILDTAETDLLVEIKNCLAKKALEGDVMAMCKLLGAKSKRHPWLGFGPDPEAQQGASVTIQVDAAQAISQLFASLKRDADPPRARIIEQAPKED